MKNTNWKAMQVPPHREQNKAPTYERPGGILPRYMSGGTWHADASKNGARRPK